MCLGGGGGGLADQWLEYAGWLVTQSVCVCGGGGGGLTSDSKWRGLKTLFLSNYNFQKAGGGKALQLTVKYGCLPLLSTKNNDSTHTISAIDVNFVPDNSNNNIHPQITHKLFASPRPTPYDNCFVNINPSRMNGPSRLFRIGFRIGVWIAWKNKHAIINKNCRVQQIWFPIGVWDRTANHSQRCLVYSSDQDRVHLLPAVPGAWPRLETTAVDWDFRLQAPSFRGR